MRILGIDYGDKRIGIAVTDESGTIASALKVIPRDGSEIRNIAALAAEYAAAKIVVGNPLNMDGTDSRTTAIIKNFARQLADASGVQVELKDERLTTWEVEKIMIEADVSRKKRKEKIDMVAACLILQSYIDNNKKN